MVSTQNPEEGRLTPEEKAERLRAARKQTVTMRRQYRTMRLKKQIEQKAENWAARHKKAHTDNYEEMEKVSGGGRPLNRRGRRVFAKRMNVFKSPGGWKHFNKHYGEKFGKREPLVKKNQSEYKSNIVQALEAAKVTPKGEE